MSVAGGWPGAGSGCPRQLGVTRAEKPVYVGWVQVRPESVENWTPDTPTPGVNGHVRSSPALHASMSMLSLAPAARMFGCTGLTARPGSFCLFCENSASLLPTVTSVEPPGVTGTAPAKAGSKTVIAATIASAAKRVVRMKPPTRLSARCPDTTSAKRPPER